MTARGVRVEVPRRLNRHDGLNLLTFVTEMDTRIRRAFNSIEPGRVAVIDTGSAPDRSCA
jgi:hypothetical protein